MNAEKTDRKSDTKRIMAAGFFWNAVYAGLNAIQSALLLFAISRTHDIGTAGMITIGFTVANLSAIMARYGMRNFMVTDVNEQFRFSDYFLTKIFSTTGALVLSFGYLAFMTLSGRYTPEKGLIILGIILLKVEGAVEELYVSRLQQKGRLDIGARIAAFRIGCSTMVMFAAIWVIPSLPVCLLLGIVTEILVDVLMIPGGKKYADFSLGTLNKKAAVRLLQLGIPLFIGGALHNYVGNGPKYLVDLYLTDGMQAVCGYVMMPMFVLSILNIFVMSPAVKGLGDAWNTDRELFRKKVIRHILLISVLTVIVLGTGLVIGLTVLSEMYNVDLQPYRKEFLILMAGGGLFTISSYMIVLLTTMRRQTGIVWGCVAATVVYVALGGTISQRAGFTGACWLYIIANAVMVCVYLLFLVRKGEHKNEHIAVSGETAASDSRCEMDQEGSD